MFTAAEIGLDERVTSFVKEGRRLLIGGQWVDAAVGQHLPVYDPATGEVLAQVAEGDREDIDRAVKAARRAFESGPWPTLTASERGRLIWKLADLCSSTWRSSPSSKSLDNGKPLGGRARRRRAAGGRPLPLHGRLGDQDRGQHDPDLGALHAGGSHTSPTRCASRSASSARSSRGTSRC